MTPFDTIFGVAKNHSGWRPSIQFLASPKTTQGDALIYSTSITTETSGYKSPVFSPAINHPPTTINYQPPTINHQPSTINFFLLPVQRFGIQNSFTHNLTQVGYDFFWSLVWRGLRRLKKSFEINTQPGRFFFGLMQFFLNRQVKAPVLIEEGGRFIPMTIGRVVGGVLIG